MSEPNPPLKPVHTHCANCGTELQGPYCHACGQPVKSIIRHVPALAEDALDLAFNIDGRIMHTLPALYFRPGFLSNEYLAGRRTRYIPPFRLMFFLSVLAFLLIQFAINAGGQHINIKVGNAFADASTPTQVRSELKRQVDGLEQARKSASGSAAASLADNGIDLSEQTLRKQAAERIAQLEQTQAPPAAASVSMLQDTTVQTGKRRIAEASTPEDVQRQTHLATSKVDTALASKSLPEATRTQLQNARNDFFITAGQRMEALRGKDKGKTQRHRDHFHVHWLPASINARLNAGVTRMFANLKAMRSDPAARQRVVAGIFNVLPQTMFVLMPLFALLLKITYLFKRRLYMEHLIVAFHSHAFIFLSLVLLALLQLLKGWLVPLAGWLAIPLNLLVAAAWIWLPTYLFLMQKRVYRQGWLLTWLKYLFVGMCYLIMLSFAISAAMLISLMG